MTSEPEVLFARRGEAGIITLNRPRALNALTHAMVREIHPRLRAWAEDPGITRVVLKASGERAFCAGGDIRVVYELGRAGRHDDAIAFWHDEYLLNAYIGAYPKPYVSLIDGICMGGGFGLSAHGTYRVAGERYLFAMPEVNIGLFPDVGGTHVLPRIPRARGVYLALTGARIKAADAFAAGLATHAVPSDRFAALEDALCEGGMVAAVLSGFHQDPGPAPLDAQDALITDVFGRTDLYDILARLDALAAQGGEDGAFAAAAAKSMRAACPTSLAIAMEQMRRGPGLDLAGCLVTEFRIVNRVARGHDFYEGVRAVLVDKDNAPRWDPAQIDAVDAATISAHFAPLEHDLPLSAGAAGA
ncbi:enoyl-CoA hydratase/isomerase family protein [Aquabacter spiritensis]|uniref:3-hydroxyisobutyryl-CoA hydrolase n=1 Tax=Aquabacter spiritensis TaxID=933073 RepID=A0A4V2UX73_9HYPH|nr:enoyl-CoA hydratase/isomerase family protein [Aquabacter spiritensis]TCT02408.1 enoyl-CoA hydratase [Aquabacter spiritensis]